MSKLLFRLRNVPEDEVDEVLQLLEENSIDVYETSAGNWGISMPALWVQNDAQYAHARELLERYQIERATRIREEYETLRRTGEAESLYTSFRDQPLRFVVYSLLIGAVAYLSVSVFFSI